MFFLLIVKKKNEFSVINIARVQNAYMYVLCMYVLIVHISNTPIRVIYIQKKTNKDILVLMIRNLQNNYSPL